MHGNRIAVLDDGEGDGDECDGLLLGGSGLLAGVLGADCPGVLLVAPEARVLVAVHAGWRGIAARIVRAALARLHARFAIEPEDLVVGIGPGIGVERYEVSTEVADVVASTLAVADRDRVVRAGRPGHAYVDLRAAIRAQLTAEGVAAERIETHPACTFDDARFFSHRRDKGVTGRHAVVAGWE